MRKLAAVVVVVGLGGGCLDIPAAGAPEPQFVLVGAGDIGTCPSRGDEETAYQLDLISGTVFTAGDNAYPHGSTQDFAACYDPSWGRHKWRTRPAAGNHDYETDSGAPYYAYFGAAAGPAGKGYYSYELGTWHVIVLNSNIDVAAGSPQEQWLRADLTANPTLCTVAIWHHPLFSSGQYAAEMDVRPLWTALYDAGAEIVISGHEHFYERFAPQTVTGQADSARGIRQFTIGTGGNGHMRFGAVAANSEVRNTNSFGLLKLALNEGSYDWQFVPVPGGKFSDHGTGVCH